MKTKKQTKESALKEILEIVRYDKNNAQTNLSARQIQLIMIICQGAL